MNREMFASPYGPDFDTLSFPAQLAVGRYLEAMKRLYPDLAYRAVVGPGNEGTVYVYIPLPLDDDSRAGGADDHGDEGGREAKRERGRLPSHNL